MTPDQTSHQDPRSRSSLPRTTVIGVCLVLVYVLSYGPIVWLGERNQIPEPLIRPLSAVYEPVFQWRTAGSLVNVPIKWYLRLWSDVPFEGDPEAEQAWGNPGYSPLP